MVSDLPGVLDLLQYMLVRDPALRPTLRDTLAKLDAILAINGHRMPAHAPSPPSSSAAAGDWDGFSTPEAGSVPASMTSPPLPLRCVLPFLPSLLLGPLSAVKSEALRAKDVRRVVVVADNRGGANVRAPLISLLDILGSEELSSCTEACAAAGAACVIISGPPGDDPSGLISWVEEALLSACLPRGQGLRARAPQLLAAQDGRIPDMAFLVVMHLIKVEGLSPYLAMVRAAHWGMDAHLTPAHLEALCLLAGTTGST